MHPILKAGLTLAVSGLCAAVAEEIQAQTVSLSTGQSCTYSTFTFTPPSNYNFQCGGASSPGVLQFNTASPGDVNQGANQTALSVTRVNGSNGVLNGTVTVASGPCTVATPAGGAVSFIDGDTTAKPLTIANSGTGACQISLSSTAVGTPTTANFTVVNPSAKGAIAFSTAGQNATATQSTAVTVNVTRSGAGAAVAGGNVDYSCTASGLNPNTNTSGTLAFGTGNGTQTITINAPLPALLASPTPGTITCSLQQEAVPGTTFDSISTGTHVVTVGPVTAPSCAPTAAASGVTTANAITVPNGVATAVTLAANCTPQGFGLTHAWTTSGGAPSLSANNIAGPTLTVPSNATAGAVFTYTVTGTNTGGGAGAAANVTITVGQPPNTNQNCQMEEITWGAGTSVSAPTFTLDPSNPAKMWAFRLRTNEIFGGTQKRVTMDGIFSGPAFAVSISKTPCEFQAVKEDGFCQVAPIGSRNFATLASSGLINPPGDHCTSPKGMADQLAGQRYFLNPGETYYMNVRPYGDNPSLPPASVNSSNSFKLWYTTP